MDRAYCNFFERRARFPRFKSKKTDGPRFHIPQRIKVENGKVYIPKIGWVRVRQSQSVDGQTTGATFKRDATGKWYICLTAKFEMPDVPLAPADPNRVVGVDLGLKDFAVLSDGNRVALPKFFCQSQRRLSRAQRTLSRRQKGSRGRARARHRVARVHRRVANQRHDFLHKLTTSMVQQFEGVCIEDLALKGLARTKLAKSVLDASLGEFRRQLEYKAVWYRRHLAVVDRFFPSSRLCLDCGYINQDLALSDREWTCPCGVCHDRDLNAARNIRAEGLKHIPVAVGHMETQNAGGLSIRPLLAAAEAEARIPRL